MADISKLSPDGGTTEYDLKDSTARANIGDLSELETTDKSDLVSAINEVAQGGSDSVTGVKGSAETNYRQGNVSISPADIGVMGVYSSKDSFPSDGEYEKTYIAQDTGSAYYWDTSLPGGWSEKNQLADQNMARTAVLAVYDNALHLYSSLGYLYRWDSDTDEWILVSDNGPQPYSSVAVESAMVEWNNDLYITVHTSGTYCAFYKWDGTNWTQLTNCPTSPTAMVVYHNTIHIFGGISVYYGAYSHYEWDGSSWVALPNITALSFTRGGAAVVFNDYIYLINGTSSIKWNEDGWSETEFTVPWYYEFGVMVVYKEAIHLISNLHKAWDGTEWIDYDTPPSDRNVYADGTVYQNAIHIVGGKSSAGASMYSLKHHIYAEGGYKQMSPSLELGEDSTTAYRGDRGATAYNDSQTNKVSIGNLDNLTTAVKTDLVSAINEVDQKITGVSGVKGDAESSYRTGDVNITKANVGLGNVENKSSSTIRSEITSSDVITALGYTPPQQDTTYDVVSKTANGLVPQLPNETTTTKYLRQDGTWAEPSGGSSGVTGVKGDSESTYRTGDVNITKANIGLGNVDNKSSSTILGELTSSNVTTALGFTPANSANVYVKTETYTKTEVNNALNGKVTLNSVGTAGQFAVSDGQGGINWISMTNAEEVQY